VASPALTREDSSVTTRKGNYSRTKTHESGSYGISEHYSPCCQTNCQIPKRPKRNRRSIPKDLSVSEPKSCLGIKNTDQFKVHPPDWLKWDFSEYVELFSLIMRYKMPYWYKGIYDTGPAVEYKGKRRSPKVRFSEASMQFSSAEGTDDPGLQALMCAWSKQRKEIEGSLCRGTIRRLDDMIQEFKPATTSNLAHDWQQPRVKGWAGPKKKKDVLNVPEELYKPYVRETKWRIGEYIHIWQMFFGFMEKAIDWNDVANQMKGARKARSRTVSRSS
jgi:hypothetical protein